MCYSPDPAKRKAREERTKNISRVYQTMKMVTAIEEEGVLCACGRQAKYKHPIKGNLCPVCVVKA